MVCRNAWGISQTWWRLSQTWGSYWWVPRIRSNWRRIPETNVRRVSQAETANRISRVNSTRTYVRG